MLRTQKGGREDRLLQKLTINRSLLSYKFITNVFQNSTLQFLRHIGICIYMGTKHVFNRKKTFMQLLQGQLPKINRLFGYRMGRA